MKQQLKTHNKKDKGLALMELNPIVGVVEIHFT